MLTNYLKLALKVLARRKFFTFVSLFGTSLTLLVLMIGTAMLDHALSPVAPEIRLDRTLFISYMAMRGPQNEWSSSPGFAFLDGYCRDLPHVERMSIYASLDPVPTFQGGNKAVWQLRLTDADYWNILDFDFLEGHPFDAGDVDAGNHVAVISETAARRLFGNGGAVGRTFETGGRTFTVIGVVRNVSRVREAAYADMWAPLTTFPSDAWKKRLMGGFSAMLLVESPRWFGEVRAEFASRLPHVVMTDPDNYKTMSGAPRTRLEQMAADMAGVDSRDRPRTGLFLGGLVVLALLFMLLPAINLVNMNISRIFERVPEIGVRKSFGATTGHLVGQFVVENVVLVLIGGAIGFVLSIVALQVVNQAGWIANANFQMNPRIFVYGVGLALFFGVLSGAYPAWRMARLDPVESLRGAHR